MSATASKQRILLVDDHPVVRQGLEGIIASSGEFSSCGAVGSVKEALALVETQHPDLVITDLSMPDRGGLELIKDLRTLRPELPVLAMSLHDELIYAERVLRAGGRGYIMKEASADRLLDAIRQILGGGIFVSEKVTNHFLEGMAGGTRQKTSFPLQRLTDRELEVFELIGHGDGNQEIASKLAISPRTVDAHRTHIRDKLHLADGTALTRYAVRWISANVT